MGRFRVSASFEDAEDNRLHVRENERTIDYLKLQGYLDAFELFENTMESIEKKAAEPQSVPVCEKGAEQFADIVKHVLLCRSCRTFVGWMLEGHRIGMQAAKTEATPP